MPRILRNILAVLAGTCASMAGVMAMDAVNHLIWPPPPGADLNDPETMKRVAASMPTGALVLLEVGWMTGTLAGSLVATLIAAPPRSLIPAFIVIGLMLVATIAVLFMLPHPMWMGPVAVIGIPLVGWLGARALRNTLNARVAVKAA